MFDVKIHGTHLTGPSTFCIDKNVTSDCSFTYSPVIPTKEFDHGYVIFSSYALGEFYYELHLTCEDLPPVVLPSMVSWLGRSAFQVVEVKNPLSYSVKLEAWSSNPSSFTISPVTPPIAQALALLTPDMNDNENSQNIYSQLILSHMKSTFDMPPFESVKMVVRYSPNSLEVMEEAALRLSGENAGYHTLNIYLFVCLFYR
jgi:hypothetical protein